LDFSADNPFAWLFEIQTTGALTPRQVCLSAIAELQQKLRNAKMLLVNLTSSRTDM
jgi:hypothetical protein